jgi:hypothetical protein
MIATDTSQINRNTASGLLEHYLILFVLLFSLENYAFH